MTEFGEEDLIAYHLGELSWWRRRVLRRRLRVDAALAVESEEIAATLREFSAEPAPPVSPEMVERSWQRVRASLGVAETQPNKHSRWIPGVALASSAAIVAAALITVHLHSVHVPRMPDRNAAIPAADVVSADPALAAHLNAAERVLTEVNTDGLVLRPEVRGQVHRLLIENGAYQRSAVQYGDMGAAEVIDNLGRVLTKLDVGPPEIASNEGLEADVSGVLFDLRILSHDENASLVR